MTDEREDAQRGARVLATLLVGVTFVTGLVDAVAFLGLDHVFVANMTGNVIFLGFALAGAPGFSWSASLVALASFLTGAVLVGWLCRPARRDLLVPVVAAEALSCAAAAVLAAANDGTTARYVTTVLLALAMGAQAAMVRGLAVADMPTTNVVTSTLTALAADHPDLGGWGSHAVRRAALVAAMLVGALVGALIVLHASAAWALTTAAILLAAVAAVRRAWVAADE